MDWCSGLLPLQVLIIPPQSYIVQQPPEHPIEPVPLLIVGRMRTSRPTKEVWRQLDYAWSAQAVMAVVWSTQNWVTCILVVAVRVTREVTCRFQASTTLLCLKLIPTLLPICGIWRLGVISGPWTPPQGYCVVGGLILKEEISNLGYKGWRNYSPSLNSHLSCVEDLVLYFVYRVVFILTVMFVCFVIEAIAGSSGWVVAKKGFSSRRKCNRRRSYHVFKSSQLECSARVHSYM